MWDGLKTRAASFLTKFTYHQRFWFFWAIFAFGVPIPTYLLFTMQSYVIKNVELEMIGNEYQSILGRLHYRIAKNQIISSRELIEQTKGYDPRKKLQEILDGSYEELGALSTETLFSAPYLGKGFSSVKSDQIEISVWKEKWNQILQAYNGLNYDNNQKAHKALLEEIYTEMQQIGYSFGLFLDTEMDVHNLADGAITKLPMTQYLIAQIFSIREWIFANLKLPEEKEISLRVMKNSLAINLQETSRVLGDAYQENSSPLQASNLLPISKRLLSRFSFELQNFVGRTQAFDALLQEFTLSNLLDKETSITLTVLNLSEDLRQVSIDQLHELLGQRKRQKTLERQAIILFYTLSAFVLTLMGICRTFSRHLIKILNHIKSLAQGNFLLSENLDPKDEFGQLGLAINKMALSVQEIVLKLKEIIQQQNESSKQIKKTTETQKEKLIKQESTISNMEQTAMETSLQARALADKMHSITEASKKTQLGVEAEKSVLRVEQKMETLIQSSYDITQKLGKLQDKVRDASAHVTLMSRISEKAKMLAVSSSIEAASSGSKKRDFQSVTEQIQRFSEDTADATRLILHVIQEMSEKGENVQKNAASSLEEIKQGAFRLGMVSRQVAGITKLVDNQINRFESLNHVMQSQAEDAEMIMQSIKNLEEATKLNTPSIITLDTANHELAQSSIKLEKTLEEFLKEKKT